MNKTASKAYGTIIHAKETAQFINLLHGPGYGEIFISGSAGTGKTFLVKKILRQETSKRFIVSYKFTDDEGVSGNFIISILKQIILGYDLTKNIILESQISTISYFSGLTLQESALLVNFIKEDENTRDIHSEILSLILKLIASYSIETVLFLDDMQWASPACNQMLDKIRLIKPEKLKIIISSRVAIDKNSIQLSNLDKDTIKALVLEKKFKSRKNINVQKIYALTNGNIFYVSFFLEQNYLKISSSKYPSHLKQLILEKFASMPSDAQRLTEAFCCLRKSINIDDLKYLAGYNPSEKNINFLEKIGFIDINRSHISISHDILKEIIFNAINLNDRRKHHHILGKAISSTISANNYDEATYHFLQSKSWNLLYKCSIKGAFYAYSRFTPELALTLIDRAFKAANELDLLTISREIKLSIIRGKIIFLLGLSYSAEKDIAVLENAYQKHSLSKGRREEVLNLISLYYWNSGKLKKALQIIDENYNFSDNSVNKNSLGNASIFLLRRIGILSDMGKFSESNNFATQILSFASNQKAHIFGLNYLFEALISSIIARNFAYLGNKIKFLDFSQKAAEKINNSNSLTKVFSLAFLADGAIRLGLIEDGYNHLKSALKIAKESRVTTLNYFLFSMLGYLEVLAGNKKSIQKIEASIQAAEDEKRYGRLPLYYLYLIKSKKHISPLSNIKRLVRRAQKLALNNSEMWVYSELSRYIS